MLSERASVSVSYEKASEGAGTFAACLLIDILGPLPTWGLVRVEGAVVELLVAGQVQVRECQYEPQRRDQVPIQQSGNSNS
jgi:hypothetical protein